MGVSRRTKQKLFTILLGLLSWGAAHTAQAQVDWKKEWERSLQEAKKEGVIVVGILVLVLAATLLRKPAQTDPFDKPSTSAAPAAQAK